MPINPLGCADAYAPIVYLGKPGAMTAIKMPDADYDRTGDDGFESHTLLSGRAVSRSPYLLREWSLPYQWLYPDVTSLLHEYATRQRGVGPFIFIDPHIKNILTPNQASGTDSVLDTSGFSVTGVSHALSSSTAYHKQGERSLLWQFVINDNHTNTQMYDDFNRSGGGSTWGTPTIGPAWQSTGSTGSDFGTNGTIAFISNASVNVMRISRMTAGADSDTMGDMRFTVGTSTGAAASLWLFGRYTDANNFYGVRMSLSTAGVLTYWLEKRVASAFTVLSSVVNAGSYIAATFYRIRLRIIGSSIKAKVWNPATQLEPNAWTFTATDTSLTTGVESGMSSRLETGNTLVSNFSEFDNFSVNSAQAGVMSLVAPTGYLGWAIPEGRHVAFSGYIRGFGVNTISVRPQMRWLNTTGGVISTITGASLIALTGSDGTFCVTGTAPVGSALLDLSFLASGTVTNGVDIIATNAGVYFDQLQLELGNTCTQWEYGDGQPLVSVRVSSENVPRIRRGTLAFTLTEVSE